MSLNGEEIGRVRRHAEIVAHVVVELFLEDRKTVHYKGKVQFVVVFNLTRFARETYDHFALRAHLKSLGISLRSATEPIDHPV